MVHRETGQKQQEIKAGNPKTLRTMPRSARRRPAMLAFAMLAVFALSSTGAHADTTIQPGAKVFFGTTQCTLNFVYKTSAGKLYIGSAGHCAKNTGMRAKDENEHEFGTVVYTINSTTTNDDFALIDIDAAKYGAVTPAV